jgi:hypothetical protein
VAWRDLPEPDEAHFYLAGAPTDPDMRNDRATCPQCDAGRLVDRARDLGVAACCGGCGYYSHEDDEVQRARVAAERARERYEREAQEQQKRAEAAARKARRGLRRHRMAA